MESRTEKRKEKGRKGNNLIIKTLERCRSMGNSLKSPSASDLAHFPKAKSCPRQRVAPEGCFSVYVGPAKEKFVIRMEYVNHPLFKMLLDEAEMEYGYATEGPLELPCDVGYFERVLWEMEQGKDAAGIARPGGCNLAAATGYQLLSPSRPAMVYRFR